MRLDEILSLPKTGVIVLTAGDSAYVTYTSSMAVFLETLYLRFMGRSGLEFKVLSPGADLETLKLHTEFYRKLYKDQGYSNLQNSYRKSIQYRVRIIPKPDFKKVDVELVSARGQNKVVGRFKNMKEARDFIETYYGADNPFCFPVYACNSDTKEFLHEKQVRLLDVN